MTDNKNAPTVEGYDNENGFIQLYDSDKSEPGEPCFAIPNDTKSLEKWMWFFIEAVQASRLDYPVEDGETFTMPGWMTTMGDEP